MTAQDKLHDALLVIAARWPYLAQPLAGVTLIEDAKVGTMGINATRGLLYAPDWVNQTALDDLVVILAWHELAGHWARDHFGRRGERHPLGWNVAGDMEINAPGTEMGDVAKRLHGCCGDKAGKTAEGYYSDLHQQAKTEGTGGCRGPAGLQDGASEAQAATEDIARDALAEAVSRAHSQGHGDIPAGLVAWAEARRPKPANPAPWRAALLLAVRRGLAQAHAARRQVPSFAHLPRRPGVDYGIVRQGMAKPPAPKVVAVVDTSGSMDVSWGEAAVAEVAALASTLSAVIACDAAPHAVPRRLWGDPTAYLGGGGTHIAPGYQTREAEGADVLIVIGDGDWHGCEQPPKAGRVIALSPSPPPWPAIHVAWGKKRT